MKYQITSEEEYSLAEFVVKMETMHPRLQPAMSEVAEQLSPDSTITAVCYTYPTRDLQDRELQMSSLLLILREKGAFSAEHLWLENRATQASDLDVPTHKWNIGEAHVLRHHVLVSPDLMGYGASINVPVCYCCGQLAARNTIDAVVAAQFILMEHYSLTDAPLPILNSGHSQGGFDALAIQRYVETRATDEEKRLFPLQQTWCADGPYMPDVVTRVCCTWPKYLYNAYMVLNAMSHMNYHPDCFEPGTNINDFLTEEGQALGLPELISAKQTGNKELVKITISALGMRPERIFTESVLRPDGKLYKAIERCSIAERQTDGWTPTLPITFYHLHADECVPIETMQAVQQLWGHLPNVRFYDDLTPLSDIPNGMAHAYSGAVFHQHLLRGQDFDC